MEKKLIYTGQNARAENTTFEASGMEGGLEPLQEEDYEYFFRATDLSRAPKKRIKILEVGCGSGPFGRRLSRNGYSVTGIDLSRVLVKAANVAAKKERTGYKAVAVDVFKYSGRGFDIVLCAGFLHHFSDPAPVIGKMMEFLRKGGDVVFIEPNGSNPAVRVTEFIRKNVWPFKNMSKLGTSNETSHSVEKYRMEFNKAGYSEISALGFVKKPKFDNYGLIMNVLLGCKYMTHVLASALMRPGIRGNVIVMRFRK